MKAKRSYRVRGFSRWIIVAMCLVSPVASFVRAQDGPRNPDLKRLSALLANPTTENIVSVCREFTPNELLSAITPQNRASVKERLKQITLGDTGAWRADEQGSSQFVMTLRMLPTLAELADNPADMRWFQSIFDQVENYIPMDPSLDRPNGIVEKGADAETRRLRANGLFGASVLAYADAARKLKAEDEASGPIFRWVDQGTEYQFDHALKALREIPSDKVIAGLVLRLKREEANLPSSFDARMEAMKKGLAEGNPPEIAFEWRRARKLLSTLGRMDDSRARRAASDALDRWEARYPKHPDRDRILRFLGVQKNREEWKSSGGAGQGNEQRHPPSLPSEVDPAVKGNERAADSQGSSAETASNSGNEWTPWAFGAIGTALLALAFAVLRVRMRGRRS